MILSEQFGFRAGHLAVEQLLLTYDDLTGMVDSGKTVDLMFFNYSEAFDLCVMLYCSQSSDVLVLPDTY